MLIFAASTATQDGFYWMFLVGIVLGMVTKLWEKADNFCS